MIWIVFLLLTLSALFFLIRPLIKDQGEALYPDSKEINLYHKDLERLNDDLKNNILSEEDKKVLEEEIKFRIIKNLKKENKETKYINNKQLLIIITSVTVFIPFSTIGIYISIGSPSLETTISSDNNIDIPDHPNNQNQNELISQLSDKLDNNPNDPEGWVLLARSYQQMERHQEALTAYRRAVSYSDNQFALQSELGEAIVNSSNGIVTPEASRVFYSVLEKKRDDPRAKFYLGLELAQKDKAKEAIAVWRELTSNANPNAPWLSMVRNEMGQVAMKANIMPINIPPRHPLDSNPLSGTSPNINNIDSAKDNNPDSEEFLPDVSNLAERFSSQELRMIQEMVGGLEARMEFGEEDYNGWMQLGRSYKVLNNMEKAAEAYRKATKMMPGEILPKLELADILLSISKSNGNIPQEVKKINKEILSIDKNNPNGLFIAGLISEENKDIELTREYWNKLLQILPESDAAYKDILQRLNNLPK